VDKIEGKVIDTNQDTFSYTRQEPVSSTPHVLYSISNKVQIDVCG
jgi:hypothetical protein